MDSNIVEEEPTDQQVSFNNFTGIDVQATVADL